MRRLEVGVAGRWFLALTVLLGVVAMVSGNNVLYLTESLLLSGLILSGILSERAISAVEIEVHRQPASAGLPSRDRVILRNTRRFPLFCLEILEWSPGPRRAYALIAFVPRLGAREEIALSSTRVFGERGWQSWEGLGVATSYPFGFARKLRLWRDPGKRRIWPAPPSASDALAGSSERQRALRPGGEISEGDVRPFVQDDDPRLIVWRLSARGGDPVVRSRRSPDWREDPRLDLRTAPGSSFESAVTRAAGAFYEDAGDSGTLTLVGHSGTRRILGRSRALDELAVIQAEGARP